MPIQYINSPEADFSLGIDARSAENQIAPGYVQDLVNGDIVEKRVRKRSGYQGYAGNLPVRVLSVTYEASTHQVCLQLDQSVSLDQLTTSPIIIYGHSSVFTTGQGPFTIDGDTAHYYSQFTSPTRHTLAAPSGSIVVSGTDNAIASTNQFIQVVESTSLTTRDYSSILLDQIRVDETTYNITLDYTTYQDLSVYAYSRQHDTITGESYVAQFNHTGSGAESITIPTSTHLLTNYNILCQIQQDNSSSRALVDADELTVSPSGDVVVTITAVVPSTYYIILAAAPVANTSTGVVGAATAGTVLITAPEAPWVFSAVYIEQTPGGIREMVLPDSITYDSTLDQIVVQFTNGQATARRFIVYWEYAVLRASEICITDPSVTVDGTDPTPQLTIWGLDYTQIYPTPTDRAGWTTYLDSYRRSGERRVLAGVGGNLFAAREYSEIGTQYLLPTLYPRLLGRVATGTVIGPVFWDTIDTPARTRGYITGTNLGANWALVTGVEYDSTTGWTHYTLTIPVLSILDSAGVPTTISSVVSTTAGLEDWLTVTQMSYECHEGTYRIRAITSTTNQVDIWVENPGNTSSDYDDPGVGGSAAILTDQMPLSGTSQFLPGDTLLSEGLDDLLPSVLGAVGSIVVASDVVTLLEVPAGVVINGERTSSLIPLRGPISTPGATVTNLVAGDMISYTGVGRLLRVVRVHADSDRAVSITGDGVTATVTMVTGDTTYLAPGQSMILLDSGDYTGVITVEAVTSTTTWTFSSTATSTVNAGTLEGDLIEVDEELDWSDTQLDSNQIRVETRWIPVEAPTDSYNLTPATHTRYLTSSSYTDQPFLRSTMVVDNMYLTNYGDEVQVMDGTSLYRAGLPAWQPGLLLTQETSGPAIVVDLRTISYSAISAVQGVITINASASQTIPVGQTIRLTGSTQTYTVQGYTDDGTTYYLVLDRLLDPSVATTGAAAEIAIYRYYYRLNMVDRNNNIVASAATSHEDYVIELTANAGVRHKLVGLPVLGNYDYARLEIQIYRTTQGQAAPFYLVTTLPINYDNTKGYLEYLDTFADADISQDGNLDVVHSALKGAELGTNWSDPLRARYVTTIGNKLVLGYLRDYPELDQQIVGDASLSNTTLGGTILHYRRDSSSTISTTDMSSSVRYEMVNGTTGTVSGFTTGPDQFHFTTSSASVTTPGSWVYLTYDTVATTGRVLTYTGWWQVAAVTGTTLTVNLVGAAAATSYPTHYVVAGDPLDVPILLGPDGSLGMVNGDSLDTFDSMRRASLAINASMRLVDVTIAGYGQFTPWLTARGGNDLAPAGRLLVRSPVASATTPGMIATFNGYQLFVNAVRYSSGDQIEASTRVYPSRISVSYENYPVIVDSPTAVLDNQSDSVIDINSADGQEITGVIPFFGESAFGAALQSAILVVFKANSIYLVDLSQKAAGGNPVQRIETEGLGCTAPYSIAPTKAGIMFANESGMYCLRRDQSIQYLGRYMERRWGEMVDLDSLELIHGHHYGVGRLYKLSVPLTSEIDPVTGYIQPSDVYVYNHTAEDDGKQGSWSRYTNHPVIGWCNLSSDAYMATTTGRVMSVRRTGTATDYRDDSDPVGFALETRANDMGNAGIRKVFDYLLVHYRSGANNAGTSLLFALDLETEYTATTAMILQRTGMSTGLGDQVSKAIETLGHSLGRRRGDYISVRVENSTTDETVEIAGLDYRVGGLEATGFRQAAQTRS